MRGVVAAGHPETAAAGAEVLGAGGNAVDAAVAAVLASFAVESPLTGFGAGGYMMVASQGGRPGSSRGESDRDAPSAGAPEITLIDFFVAAPGLDGIERGTDLVPVPVHFDATTVQTFYVGPASCGVPGTAAGLEQALRRFGTMPLAELVGPGVRLARRGAPLSRQQAYLLEILEPIHGRMAGTRELYAPGGARLGEGDRFAFAELAEALERYGAEGAEPFYRGEVAAAITDFVVAHGGSLGPGDLASYEPIERRPIAARFRGTEVLTNPPPSAGGTLVAHSLGLLEQLGPSSGPEQLVAAMRSANRLRAEMLGSTTHIAVMDAAGSCASVTCSNGSGSGVLVPGTGVILNNMLGEEDLNPLGFHRIEPGRRVPSMMAPTVVLRDGEIVLGLGSAGSNRIRSAILQTVVRTVEQGLPLAAAIEAPRLHFEAGAVQAEPGIDPAALDRLEAQGLAVVRWPAINLFFGGVQAVARDPRTGALSGGGDPRRGGAVASA
ncbi:MAG: gamma-glutamyltransferase [Actinobacteria bacterium]|nr:gamma-glutamyltransferase [Actinomycetota bacterium]